MSSAASPLAARRLVTAAPAVARSVAPVAAAWTATRRAPAATLEEGAARLAALSATFSAAGDRRAVFAATYLIQIEAFAEDVKRPGSYAHPAWMTRMTLDFLQRYLDAVEAYDSGDRAAVPQAWRTAFDRAKAADGPVVSDLLLAMNAHINHDLPLALVNCGASATVQADYVRFNRVLADHIDAVQALVSDQFLKPGSLAAAGDRLAGPLDEAATAALIRDWRATAWTQAKSLQAKGEAAYPTFSKRSSWRAAVLDGGSKLIPSFLAKRGLL